MENKILEIVTKVKLMFKYDKRFKNLLSVDFEVTLIGNCKQTENAPGFEIEEIIFELNDEILEINKNTIIYTDSYGRDDELINYEGFDELLNM